MLSFLNASVLFAAAAALIPLIIHLFSRRRVKVIEFSSLRHLKAMQRRQVRRLKIRQLLLLIVRMLIILAVVMAFARPTTKSGQVGAHASVTAVILLDNSASMNKSVADGNLFEIAKKRTAELIETFGQADEVLLVPLDKAGGLSTGNLAFTSAAVASEQLEAVTVGYGRADLSGALDNASRLMETVANLNREIYIVSDRQMNSLPEDKLLSGTEAKVYVVDLPIEDAENCGIVSVDFGGQLIQPGNDFDLVATVRGYGTGGSTEKIASLFLNGNRVAQSDFRVTPGSESAVRFTRSVSRTGYHSGWVEISDDKFTGDNRYYFSFHVPERFNLLIINGDNASQYISLALVPNQSLSQYWSVKEASPAELSGVNFLDYDVIMLTGAPRLSGSYVSRLKAFVKRGRALFVSYGGDTDIGYFNQTWSEVTGVVYDEPIAPSFTRAGYYTVQSIENDHPVFSVFDFGGDDVAELPEIKFFTLPKLHLDGSSRPLMHFTGNRPALVESSYEGGKVLCFTGPMSLRFTDLAGHAFFVPFISRVAEYLASDLSTLDLRLYSGDQITRSLSLTGSITYPVELVAPDSSAFSIPPEEEKGALVVRANPTDQPGIYHITYLGREIDRFAVNIVPDEGNLESTDLDQFAQALGAEELRQLETGEPLDEVIAGFRFGRELWQLFLWLAVILVVIEVFLSRGTSRDESNAGE